MTKRITKLMAALALLVFMAPSMVMWGQTSVTWPGTTALPGTATTVANDQNVTIMVSSTNTYTNPIRIYANTTVTINALNNAKILSVAYEASSTGNYVTYAQNATVTPNVTPTVSGKIVTWTYAESANVTEFTFKPSTQTRSNGITITYIIPSATPTCATPTFSPAGGTYSSAQNVSISCSTEGATIYYTTDGQDPTTSSTVYSGAINVSTNTTIKAMAAKSGYDNSAVASATYTFVSPMTIAEVREQETGDVVTTGTVTSCVGTTGYIQDATAAICVYGTALTVGDNISVLGTLSLYNGLLEITNPQVTVISSGNSINPETMTIAQVVASTNQGWYIRIEDATVTAISDKNVTIAQGDDNVVVRFANTSDISFEVNDIISFNGNIGAYNGVQIANPQNVTVQENTNPSITADNVNIAAEATSGSIAYTINNPATNGAMAAATASDWLTLGTNFDSPIAFTCTANTATTARTATVVLTYTYNTNQTVTKEVTVTQAAYEAPHVTWDLSIASYDEVTDPDLVTWSSNYATMTNATGNGTSASNYLGGDANNRTSSRFYTNNVWTLSPAAGYAITSVVLTATSQNYANAFAGSEWTNATASADGTIVTVTPTDGTTDISAVIGGTCGFTSVTVYYVVNNAPSITANNVEITYDTDADEIEYEISNPVQGGVLTASTESDWLTLGTVGATVPFTCTVNEAGNARTATVTLTYTYNRSTVTKDVTVTQAGNPNATMTIAEVREQQTGDVVTKGIVTSCVGTTGYIQDATAAICVFGVSLTVGDEIRVSGALSTYHGLLEITNPQVTVISQGNTVNPEVMTIADINASTNQGWYIRIENATVTEINDQNTTIAQGENTIVVRGISGVEYAVNDIISLDGNIGCYNVAQIANPTNVTVQQNLVPTVTVTPNIINAPAEGAEGNLALAYENITEFYSFDFYFCDAEGEELQEDPDWIDAEINPGADGTYILDYLIDANNGEARTAYMKVYTYDDDEEEVYAIVTINQAQYVIDYATLPFEWEGGSSADFLALNGTSASGLGSDYAAGNAPYLIKFDGTGDYIQVKTDSRPGFVTIGVKMIGGATTSTITVQGSSNGGDFTDIQVLTISGAQNSELTLETTSVFAENDRYVRLYFTKGSNVGVGPITIAQYTEPVLVPSITVNPATVDENAEEHDGTLDLTYENMTITDMGDFDIQYYDAEGEETDEPDWIEVLVAEQDPEVGEGYVVSYYMLENEGTEARSAYFKVYAMDDETNLVYSNLVTINQAGAPQQYTLTVEPFENLELITFVNDEMVMEGDGEYQVNEGDQIMLSIVALEGYVMETLMVNGVNHVNDIADDYTYSFEMPAENVTISATAVEDVPVVPSDTYVKVTSNAQLTSGQYLIVYEEGEVAFDGRLETLDAADNTIGVTINDNEIVITNHTAASEFTIDMNAGTIMSASGYYIGLNTQNTNGMQTSTETAYTNSISIDNEGNANIVSSGEAHLRYNNAANQNRFRYYKSSTYTGQKAIQLYKRMGEPTGETFTLEITGWANETNPVDYYLIASPIEVNPDAIPGMVRGSYDLYSFLESGDENGNEWINYNQGVGNAPGFNRLEVGKGYLYAHSTDITLEFTGTPVAAETFDVELDRTPGAEFEGRNLVGNPFTVGAYIDREYYIMNSTGTNYVLKSSNDAIAPMTGIMVEAETDGETLTFSKTAPETPGQKVVMNVTSSRSNIVDRATIRFGEGRQLHKFMFNPNCTKLYIPQADEEFAVVRSSNEAEMPVSFKAAENGTYTISFSTEEVEMDYMHLIDNVTGDDIDLLATPSYTFVANTTDYANRFNLVFATTDGVNENSESHFAFYNGSSWVISNKGNATLQVVDMLGRVLSSESINGNATMSAANLSAGVYVMRLINGNVVKTQKVVVK